MACSNCFNGCAEIVSDQCVKYTGIDVPVLGIKNGDSLSYVEQALIGFLTSTLDGTGIKIDIPQNIICQLVSKYLPTCGDLSVVDLITALVKAACDLQVQVTGIAGSVADIQSDLATLEGPYDVDCLTGVTSTSGTHNILQAVIDQLCAFIIDVETNYVQLADLDDLIQAYLDSQSTNTSYYAKMIPYTAVEYYGPITGNFDVTGAGIGPWEKIYLCNGNNGTPDKRGRVPVGAIVGVGGGSLDPAVDPNISPFNPAYSISGANSKSGVNSVILTQTQMPTHTHNATITLNPHNHSLSYATESVVDSVSAFTIPPPVVTQTTVVKSVGVGPFNATTGDANLIVTNSSVGGNQAHQNNQPALACYYIMYIP